MFQKTVFGKIYCNASVKHTEFKLRTLLNLILSVYEMTVFCFAGKYCNFFARILRKHFLFGKRLKPTFAELLAAQAVIGNNLYLRKPKFIEGIPNFFEKSGVRSLSKEIKVFNHVIVLNAIGCLVSRSHDIVSTRKSRADWTNVSFHTASFFQPSTTSKSIHSICGSLYSSHIRVHLI